MVTEIPSDGVCESPAGHPALDLANTADRIPGLPWVERLPGYPDLLTWSVTAHILSPADRGQLARRARARSPEAEAVLERAHALRESLYRIFTALAADTSPAQADLTHLNSELAQALSHCRIEARGGGFSWSWDADAPELDRPLWPIARAAAELLTSPERALVKRCASETCEWLFLDRTKNHARRWCDMKICGNRAKVRRHRRRTAAS